MTILVTGGAGFIGSNFIHHYISNFDEDIINLDKLTYAGNPKNLTEIEKIDLYSFVHGSICDQELVARIFKEKRVKYIINFAAESHVDRSIHGPGEFIQTNIVGTFNLLDCATKYYNSLSENLVKDFRFLHVSTDEVYGTLDHDEEPFNELNQFKPNSPYAASKASSDHLVRAYNKTYGLPTLITNCSNNYGPYQFPEKLIPLIINNALKREKIPIYGDGNQIRDWLHVRDHCDAITAVLKKGRVGETYNVGGLNEKTNLEVVNKICEILDELQPSKEGSYANLITYVKDRPGHDRRYAIDASKINYELDWKPNILFHEGIYETVKWYLDNQMWIKDVISGEYKIWIQKNYSS